MIIFLKNKRINISNLDILIKKYYFLYNENVTIIIVDTDAIKIVDNINNLSLFSSSIFILILFIYNYFLIYYIRKKIVFN